MTTEHDFVVKLKHDKPLTAEHENALFEAGCDDSTIGFQDGFVQIAFTRCAESKEDAINSALEQIRKANIEPEVYSILTFQKPSWHTPKVVKTIRGTTQPPIAC